MTKYDAFVAFQTAQPNLNRAIGDEVTDGCFDPEKQPIEIVIASLRAVADKLEAEHRRRTAQ